MFFQFTYGGDTGLMFVFCGCSYSTILELASRKCLHILQYIALSTPTFPMPWRTKDMKINFLLQSSKEFFFSFFLV